MENSRKICRFDFCLAKDLRYLLQALFICFIFASGLFPAHGAEPEPGSQPAGQKTPIQITSDFLTSDNEAGIAEFSGNVKAIQGETVILSDRLKIYYKDTDDPAKNLSGGIGAIEKIIASGNVNIKFEGKKAVSDEAEYLTASRVLTLSGPNTKVTSRDESISGAKIILYRSDGRIKVESSEKKRVEAIFYSTEHLDGD